MVGVSSHGVLFYFVLFEPGSDFVAQAGLDISIPLLPESRDYSLSHSPRLLLKGCCIQVPEVRMSG